MTYTEQELLHKLQQLYNNYGDTLSSTIDSCNDMPHSSTYRDHFGSINTARSIAGVDKRKFRKHRYKYQLLETLRDMERGNGPIYADNVERILLYNSQINMSQARRKAGLIFTNPPDKWRDKFRMINELSDIIDSIDGTIRSDDIDNLSNYSSNEYRYVFQSLAHAKDMAGSENVKSRDECFWSRTTGKHTFEQAKDKIRGYQSSAEYYVYEIAFDYGESYYVGQTSDLQRRMSEKSCSPDGTPTNISITSVNTLEDARQLERDRFFDIAIEEDTNNVYGGK